MNGHQLPGQVAHHLDIIVPEGVDGEQALAICSKVVDMMAQGYRAAFIALPADLPDSAMPLVMAAAVQAAKLAQVALKGDSHVEG